MELKQSQYIALLKQLNDLEMRINELEKGRNRDQKRIRKLEKEINGN